MTDAEKAVVLTARVEATIDALAEELSGTLGIEKRWILAEFVYIATQRVRADVASPEA